MYQKNVVKHADLLLIGKEGKRHYVFIQDFNTFKYDHTLHHGKKKHFIVIVYRNIKMSC